MNAQTKVEAGKPTGLALLREPFPANLISKLPKPYKKDAPKGKCNECGGFHGLPAMHLSYVGHAALTDRLLDADPAWNWEPMAFNPDGSPAFDQVGGLWIKLTVCGQTRLGYGHAEGKRGGDAIKEVIGDALRNAAMRFGAALDLWHKGDLHADESEEAAPEQRQTRRRKPEQAGPTQEANAMPAAEFARLQHMLAAAGIAPAVICSEYKVKDIGKLNPDQYADAIARLEDEIAKKAKTPSNQRARRNDFAGADLDDAML